MKFSTSRRVEFRDTDAAGIAHFSVFYVWMEQAEHEALRHVGLSVMISDAQQTISWPRVSANCDFKRPVRFEDIVTTEVSISEMSEKSVTYRFQFTCQNLEIAVGQITTVCCHVTPEGLTSIPIPPHVAAKLSQLTE